MARPANTSVFYQARLPVGLSLRMKAVPKRTIKGGSNERIFQDLILMLTGSVFILLLVPHRKHIQRGNKTPISTVRSSITCGGVAQRLRRWISNPWKVTFLSSKSMRPINNQQQAATSQLSCPSFQGIPSRILISGGTSYKSPSASHRTCKLNLLACLLSI